MIPYVGNQSGHLIMHKRRDARIAMEGGTWLLGLLKVEAELSPRNR